MISLALISLVLSISLFYREKVLVERWVRTEALPELRHLIDAGEFAQALDLATEVESKAPGDPTLAQLWPEFSVEASITSEPTGVDVSIRNWNATEAEWRQLGTTPINHVRLPKGHLHNC